MTSNPIQNPVTIDYTGRDYYSIRDALISRVKDRVPDWKGTSASDFGLALIEAFSHVGDLLSYYIDRSANETAISTATRRSSILNLAYSYGYTPQGYRTSQGTISLKNNTANTVSIPVGTQLRTSWSDGDIIRESTVLLGHSTAISIAAGGTYTLIPATEGERIKYRSTNDSTWGEQVAESDGTPGQTYRLQEPMVVDGSVNVYVQSGSTYVEWTKIDHLVDANPTDLVYTSILDENGYLYIQFGDGVSGAIPNLYASIKVDYTTGGGQYSNLPVDVLTYANGGRIFSMPGVSSVTLASYNLPTGITVTASSTFIGGREPDSNDLIKILAPLALRTKNRAVTLDDYANIALLSPGCAKANAIANTWNSVTIYAAPNQGVQDPYPLYDSTGTVLDSSVWTSFKSDVLGAFTDKTQIGVSVQIVQPTYVPVTAVVEYSLLPQLQGVSNASTTIEFYIRKIFETYFSYSSMKFGQVIYPEVVDGLLRQIDGVRNIRLRSLYRSSESAGRKVLRAEANELFAFPSANITGEVLSYVSTLTNIAATVNAGSGTLYPTTFSPSVTSYNLVVSTATSITLTLTKANTGETVSVLKNGSSTGVSGTGPYTISPIANNDVYTITVTSQDGVNITVYTVTLTK